MIHANLPDGAARALSDDVTAVKLASDISKSLAKRTVGAVVNEDLSDLSATLLDGATVELICRDDPRAHELIRHDLAHVWQRRCKASGPTSREQLVRQLSMVSITTSIATRLSSPKTFQ